MKTHFFFDSKDQGLAIAYIADKVDRVNPVEYFNALGFRVIDATIHKNFIELLETYKKTDQEILLKNQTINPEQLFALIVKSYTDYGYLYSHYNFENLPSGIEGKKLPNIFHLNRDGTIEKFGDTDLKDGELKNIIEHRKVVVSHFLEKENMWHCFFFTYNSLRGKENWKNGQSHFHYMSSAFNISKEDFIESMRNGRYKSTKIHIDLLDYGNQV